MSIILKLLVLGLGILISFFIVWKKLREDYSDEKIFSFSLGVIGGIILGYIGTSFIEPILPGIKFWGAIAGGGLLGTWLSKKLSIRFFEALEAVIPAVFVYLIFESLTKISWLQVINLEPGVIFQFAQLGGVTLSLLVFVYASRNFRRFMWYPSGKIGIASLLALAVFFIFQVVLANAFSDMLTLLSRATDTTFGVFSAMVSLVVVYIRSGRDLKRDFRFSKSSRRKR